MDNELSHHGIKGMRWGVRRFQNHDGSLTDAGRKRYGSGTGNGDSISKRVGAKLTVFGKKKTASKPKETEEEKQAKLEAKKKEVLSSRSAKEIYKNADLFSDQELQAAYNRLNTERNIKNLIPQEVSKGQQYADKMVKAGKTFNDVADAGIKTYNTIAKLYNTFSTEGRKKPLPIIKDNDKKSDNDDKKDGTKRAVDAAKSFFENQKKKADNSSKKDESKDSKKTNADSSSNNSSKERVYEGEWEPASKNNNSSNAQKKSEPEIINMEYVGNNTYAAAGRNYMSTYVRNDSTPVSSADTSAGERYIAGLLEEPKK